LKDHRQVEQLAGQEARGHVEVSERVHEPRIPTVLEGEADPQQADFYAGETKQESHVLKRPHEDPQALSREHHHFEHDPGAQQVICSIDELPAWSAQLPHCRQSPGGQRPPGTHAGGARPSRSWLENMSPTHDWTPSRYEEWLGNALTSMLIQPANQEPS
jgi:hypothetical protein